MKEYTKDDLTVLWNSSICIHAGTCAKGMPSVFKPRERPWIQLDNGSAEGIIAQVNQCPSGAISIKE